MYLPKHEISFNNDMQDVLVMNWIQKMPKNPICIIIASPVCSMKPLSKDMTLIFKLFYRKAETYCTKENLWSRITTIWNSHINYKTIPSIDPIPGEV